LGGLGGLGGLDVVVPGVKEGAPGGLTVILRLV